MWIGYAARAEPMMRTPGSRDHVDSENWLGGYLRLRRGLVRPEDVGLPERRRRRVSGLRREELAQLAGISVVYLSRLEQGYDQHPSEQVVDALARALLLDAEATEHLHRLSHPAAAQRIRPTGEGVPASVARIVTDHIDVPAYVLDRLRTVVVANRFTTALVPMLFQGANQLRALFLDPRARTLFPDWTEVTEDAVASLRVTASARHGDEELTDLIAAMSADSEWFRELWSRHDAGLRARDLCRFDHPVAGLFELRYDKLAVVGADHQTIVVYHADPGSAGARALEVLRATR